MSAYLDDSRTVSSPESWSLVL